MTNEQVQELVRHLLGSRYVHSVQAYVAELTGREVRGGSDLLTADRRPGRVTIYKDVAGNIASFQIEL